MGESKVVRRLVKYVNLWCLGQTCAILLFTTFYIQRLILRSGSREAGSGYDLQFREDLYAEMSEHGVPY